MPCSLSSISFQQILFKIEMASSVLKSIRKDDFTALVDLKDAHFQVPIHKAIESASVLSVR